MSDSGARSRNEANKNQRQNLPSWMSSSDNGNNSHGKKSTDADNDEENEETKQAIGQALRGGSSSNKTEQGKKSAASSFSNMNFSKLLVLFFFRWVCEFGMSYNVVFAIAADVLIFIWAGRSCFCVVRVC